MKICGAMVATAALAGGLLFASSAFALSFNPGDYVPIEASSGAVVPGEWNSDIVAGQAYADANYIPMLAIGGSETCSHCHAMQTACNTDEFKAWAEGKKIVMVFGEDAATRQKCRPPDSSSLPFVWVHWRKPDGSVVDIKFTGMLGNMPSKEGATLTVQLINSCDLYIGAYPELTGSGYLSFTNAYANARLEAEVGLTDYVEIPLVRDLSMKGFVGTNLFTAVYKGAVLVDRQIVWTPAATEMYVRVDIPEEVVAGDEIDVSLRSFEGDDRGSATIFIVEEKENSTKNPLFIGERTAETLGYGEWTMDMDVAMEKYAAEPESRLMAIASGSLWCPDCVMTDEHVLENPAFKEWAKENKVILVDIDVPNFPNTTNSACLLTYVTGRTSDGYISGRGTLATNELERYQSGAGYLSRHMVSATAAKAALERNRSLVGRNTLNGGWNNPDRANQNRTGIPNFFSLRRDGSLAGAFETFDAIGPSSFKAAYLKRFSELIAMGEGGDDGDFANRSWQTTEDSFSGDGELTGATLAPLDLSDTYLLDAISSGAAVQTITAKGGSATATLEIIAVSGGAASTVATSKGPLADGISVTCTMTPTEKYYVKITGAAEGVLAADSELAFEIVEYVLSGERTPVANPYENDWTEKAARATLPLYTEDGSGLAGSVELQLKKNGKISAKIFDPSKRIATLAGVWDGDIAADGTATAVLQKGDVSLKLVVTAAGVLSATFSGTQMMTSGQCALADSYADWAGTYAVALPLVDAAGAWLGHAYMTLSMGTDKSSVSRGKMKYRVFLPDGKKLSGTTGVTGRDANFGVVPITKASGPNAFRASLLVRRNAGSAPTRRAVISDGGVAAVWQGKGFSRRCEVFGSLINSADSLLERAAVEELAFIADVSGFGASERYGELRGALYDGGVFLISPTSMAPETKIAGFTFKLNRKTGIFSGKTKLSFARKESVSASFSGVILPDWFSDCECQEDDDIVVPMTFLPFGVGQCLFADTFEGMRIKRSIPVFLGTKAIQ